MRERSACPPELQNVDYGCFDGQRKLDHTNERLQGGFKVPMETGRNLEHTTERHQRGLKVPNGQYVFRDGEMSIISNCILLVTVQLQIPTSYR